MGRRRRAREAALQILFGLDWTADSVEHALEHYWAHFAGERPAAYDFVRRQCQDLVQGVANHLTEIDRRLQASSHHWKLGRMGVVDRNIMRLATFELMFRAERAPRKVVLNEAIEIAKKFGSEDSAAFVNGILDRVAIDIVRDGDAVLEAAEVDAIRQAEASATKSTAASDAAADGAAAARSDQDVTLQPGAAESADDANAAARPGALQP